MSLTYDRRRLSGRLYEGQIFEREDLRNALAFSIGFNNCVFLDCRFGQARFEDATFLGCRFSNGLFGQASLSARFRGCSFDDCDFDQASFVAAEITDTRFTRCRFQYANFTRATLRNVQLRGNLHGAILDFAASHNIDFSGSDLWAAVVPLNCSMLVGNRFDRRQIHQFLALLCRADGEWRDALLPLVDPRAIQVVDRLVRIATDNGRADASGGDSARAEPSAMGSQTPAIGSPGSSPSQTERGGEDGRTA